MPAELVARLRAEGLLPEDAEPPPSPAVSDRSKVVPRPGVPRPIVRPSTRPPEVDDAIPSLIPASDPPPAFSEPPPQLHSEPPNEAATNPNAAAASAAAEALKIDIPLDQLPAPPPPVLETPVAFSSPRVPSTAPAPLASVPPEAVTASEAPADLEAKPKRNGFVILLVLLALGVAVVMALARLHR